MESLVDSGAVYSVVPTPVLRALGIMTVSRQEFRLADGSKFVRGKCIALLKFGDHIGGADVIFGEAGDSRLLGALTLEAVGLALDPQARYSMVSAGERGSEIRDQEQPSGPPTVLDPSIHKWDCPNNPGIFEWRRAGHGAQIHS